ncbi:DUF6252 family protein [Emticicia sp. C21]|uniref:DUF6252 family protein n=1 Tax=Emticicia sp. C21 TaxID=2302915 RepID=UPI000E85B369|nr:DUF6252 family protein [Emticicia sp. C21]RFS15556.1 hypothetical protein D0T08_15510 [Emticicia sp. C21]
MTKRLINILLSLFLVSCDNLLPLPIRWGNDSFGCKVEGITMKASSANYFARDKPISARITDSTFYISGSDYNDKLDIAISLGNIRKKGTYYLDNITGAASYENRNYPSTSYKTYNQYGGQVHITKFDVKNKIVSGTFSFKAAKVDISVYPNTLDTTKVIEITRGRFDVNLK